jgi:hypothetical protein
MSMNMAGQSTMSVGDLGLDAKRPVLRGSPSGQQCELDLAT